ncbi:MAG: hypothetical protein ACXABV_15900 [Candidatus Thorarchaeota archaeon]
MSESRSCPYCGNQVALRDWIKREQAGDIRCSSCGGFLKFISGDEADSPPERDRLYGAYTALRKKTKWDYIREGRPGFPMSSSTHRRGSEHLGDGRPLYRCCILIVFVFIFLLIYMFLILPS